MEGKDAIIERILSDAKVEAENKIGQANAKAEEILSEANKNVKEIEDQSAKDTDLAVTAVINGKKTVGSLDTRKIILAKKREVVDEAYKEALKTLQDMDDENYKKFVLGMLDKYAEKDDIVMLSADGVITPSDVRKTKVYEEKKLTVSDVRGSFVGGLYLVGAKCDKDLTFATLIEKAKNDTVAKISEILFED